MNIYLVYKGSNVICVTTMPRIVLDELKSGGERVDVWQRETRVKTLQNAREFMRYVNPRPIEDDETGGAEYEW